MELREAFERESREAILRRAKARLWLCAFGIPPAIAGLIHLNGLAPHWGFSVAFALLVLYGAGALIHRRLPLFPRLMALGDILVVGPGSLPAVHWVKANGASYPHAVPALLLMIPAVIHSFGVERPRWEVPAACTLGYLFLHAVVPATYPAPYRYGPEPFVVCFLFWFIHAFAVSFNGRLSSILARAADREIWRERLRRFLPDAAVARLEREGGVRLGGTSQEATILFCDARHFTSTCERLDPRDVVSLLNEHFTRMVEVVFRHGGTVDKFLGDGLLIVFPGGRQGALTALACAREMQARALAALPFAIGIHQGPVIAGWIGSERRPEYTVLGTAVNIASRLESACKELGESIVISAEVASHGSDGLVSLGTHPLKGIAEPRELFAVREARAAAG